jgi:hypothetical protein
MTVPRIERIGGTWFGEELVVLRLDYPEGFVVRVPARCAEAVARALNAAVIDNRIRDGAANRAPAAALSPERRTEIARRAARARWGGGAIPVAVGD